MSSALPLMKAKEVIKLLGKMGFEFKRQKGSHMFFAHPDGRTTESLIIRQKTWIEAC